MIDLEKQSFLSLSQFSGFRPLQWVTLNFFANVIPPDMLNTNLPNKHLTPSDVMADWSIYVQLGWSGAINTRLLQASDVYFETFSLVTSNKCLLNMCYLIGGQTKTSGLTLSICNGLFQKISTSPYGRHWIGYLEILGFPRTVAVYAGFQTLLIQNLWEFQNFAIFWMVLPEFRSKFKILGEIYGIPVRLTELYYRISNVVHGVCVGILWNGPIT